VGRRFVSALGAGVNNAVRALAVIGTGLYAGGSFTTAEDPRRRALRNGMAPPGRR